MTEAKPQNTQGEFVIRWRPANEGGGIYVESFTRYPPRDGETWSRGNDGPDGMLSPDALLRIQAAFQDVLHGWRT